MTESSQIGVVTPEKAHLTSQRYSWFNLAPMMIIVGIAIVLALPMLLYGPLIDGHDTHEHLNYIRHFSVQFWQGDWYPRWLMGMNAGLGSPTYFVFPPLPAYACVALDPLARLLRVNAFDAAAFLALVISGMGIFLWLQTGVDRKIALGCALLYMVMPYHLSIDFYWRCALPEFWAMAWMPLVLYFAVQVTERRRNASLGLAVAFALMIVSHLISVAMFFLVPIALAALIAGPGQKIKDMFRVIAAMALGTGLSAIYLFPALDNARYIPASRIITVFKWSDNLVHMGKSLFIYSAPDHFLLTLSWILISMVMVVVLCGFALLKWGGRGLTRHVLFWLLVCAGSALMITRLSSPVWRHVLKIAEAIQFPWRFNAVLCVGTIWLIALFFSKQRVVPKVTRNVLIAVMIIIFSAWLVTYGEVWHWYKVDVWNPPHDENHLVNDSDGWFAAWIPPGTIQRSSLSASAGPKATFKEGSGSAIVQLWKPRNLEVQTNSVSGGWLMVNQFYYPTWQANISGKTGHLTTRVAMPEGLLEIAVPSGRQDISVRIPPSLAERGGEWASLFFLLFGVVIAFSTRAKSRFHLRKA